MSGSHVDAYHKMKQEQRLQADEDFAKRMNSLGNRGIPHHDLYTALRTGTSIPQTSSIKLTREEIEKKELAQHLKEYLQIQAEYKRRQAEAEAEAAAAAAAGPKSPKSQKSPKSPSKGSKGGSKRNRRNNRNRTYRGRPTRSRSSRRNA